MPPDWVTFSPSVAVVTVDNDRASATVAPTETLDATTPPSAVTDTGEASGSTLPSAFFFFGLLFGPILDTPQPGIRELNLYQYLYSYTPRQKQIPIEQS
jgi:hypothetical protein